jgi:hypothetical protein
VRCDPHPGEPCEGPPRALRGRAHPSDVGVRRLPALHLRRLDWGPRSPRAGNAASLRTLVTERPRRIALFMIRSV